MKTLLALTAAACAALPAHALQFQFTQTGYADAALVQGLFSGTDLDADGVIYGHEITDYTMSFSGNSVVAAFTHDHKNLHAIEFHLDTFELVALNSGSNVGRGLSFQLWGAPLSNVPGHIAEFPRSVITMSFDTAQVSAVPEASPYSMTAWPVSQKFR